MRGSNSRILLYALFTVVSVVLMCSCVNKRVNPSQDTIADKIFFPGSPTCISTSTDSQSLYIGLKEDCFVEYNILHGTQTKYELPAEFNGVNKYMIYQLDFDEFLVSNRNRGVLYVRYKTPADSNSVYNLEKYVYLSSEMADDTSPKKGLNYSAYNLEQCNDILFIGTSNGLMYVDRSLLDSIRNVVDNVSKVEVPYYKPLRELRQHKMQFAIEDLVVSEDHKKIIAISDSGIYRMNLDFSATSYDRMLAKGRFWSSYFMNDTLYAECIDSIGKYYELIIGCPFSDSFTVDKSFCSDGHRILHPFGRISADKQLEYKGEKYDIGFQYIGQESIQKIGDYIYYLTSNSVDRINLNYLDIIEDLNYSPMRISVAAEDGLYFINSAGLYKLDSGSSECRYLGGVEDLPNVKDAVYHKGYVYVCDDVGIYKIDVSDYLFAYDRKTHQVEDVVINSPDRIECISESSSGESIYIGTRSGLYEYADNGSIQKVAIKNDAFHDSPYITDIVSSNEKTYAGTLNYGLHAIGSTASVINDYKSVREILSLDLRDEKLLIQTSSSVLIIDALTHQQMYNIESRNIIDAKFLDTDTLCVLSNDSVMLYSMNDVQLTKISSVVNSFKYNTIQTVNGDSYFIADYSIVNGMPIKGQSLRWIDVVYYAFGCVLIILILAVSIFMLVRQRKSHLIKEKSLLDNYEIGEEYKMAATQLINYLPVIKSNLELYDEMEADLGKLVDSIIGFSNDVSPILDSVPNDENILLLKNAYQQLYDSVGLWFHIPQIDSDKDFDQWIGRCRYGLQVLNIYSKKGIKLLIENPNEISNKEFELEKSMTWELFVRFTLCNQSIEESVSQTMSKYADDAMSQKDFSLLRKKLKERIDHKNVGPIPNLLIRNLSHHIWTTDCHKVASTPYDVVWLACGLNCNTNGLIERLEYAYTQKSL